MDQFPTEEEEFEMLCNEEMEIQQEEDEMIMNMLELPNREVQLETSPPNSQSNLNELIPKSPHTSQSSFGNLSQISNIGVNRKLFGTPTPGSSGAKVSKYSSTPFHKTGLGKTRNQLPTIISNIIVKPPNSAPQSNQLRDFSQHTTPFDELQFMGLDRKRKIQELFGDIYDIDDGEEHRELKKLKSEEERDLELITKILEARQKVRTITNPLHKKSGVEKLNVLNEFKKMNLSRKVPNWPCIPMECRDGARIYIRFHSVSYENQHINEISCCGAEFNSYKGLLGESKAEVWNEAQEIFVKHLTKPSSSDVEIIEVVENHHNTNSKNSETLWVEKYKPKKYIDLLSDETTNRSLLYWLKMWDKIVFGREVKQNTSVKIGNLVQTKMSSFNKRTGKFESNGGWNRRVKQNLNTERDERGRPIQKIALLCGPPGLGKTTLAHTIAKHAGYNIREMNASDDRNPDAFRLALENGTQMTSILNEDKKPNCIILDEIDGAPSQSIDFLIQFINDNCNSRAKKIVGGQKTSKNILKRPIICICNDMYAPALRQLRQIAFVVNFPPIESGRLAERLLDISYKEKMLTDMSTLLALAEKSGNDVRSCISMMQFFNANKKRLTLQDVLTSNFGQKDGYKGLFAVWTSIFQIQKPQRQLSDIEPASRETNYDLASMANMTLQTRANYVLRTVHMGGDYERLMQGVYENFLQQKMPDSNFNGVTEALQWFCFSDLLQNQISKLQNYTVYPYLQYGFVMWHFLFSSAAWPKLIFPSKGYEVNQKTTVSKMIFQAFRKGLSSKSLGIGQGTAILMDTVPFLKKILSPNLRCVSLQLLTAKERYDLTHTVQIMADLGLSFTQTKTADGTYQYSIEPDIDLLSKYQGLQGITLSYFGRQLIAREVELEQINRATPKAAKLPENKAKPVNEAPKTLPNHLQFLKPQIRHNNKQLTTKDFFGRIMPKESGSSAKDDGNNSLVKSPIWYRFKQGFNNAVRKDVIISDIL